MNASKLTDINNHTKKPSYEKLYIMFPENIIIQNNQQSISINIEFIWSKWNHHYVTEHAFTIKTLTNEPE